MKYIIGLKNSEGKQVTAITDMLNENETEVSKQVLGIANSLVKNGESRVLSSASKYNVVSIKTEDSKNMKTMKGNRNYDFLVFDSSFKIFEDKVLGVAGEKSAYNSVMKYLVPNWSEPLLGVLIYLIDSNQAKYSNNKKLKASNQVKEVVGYKGVKYKVLAEKELQSEYKIYLIECNNGYLAYGNINDIQSLYFVPVNQMGTATELISHCNSLIALMQKQNKECDQKMCVNPLNANGRKYIINANLEGIACFEEFVVALTKYIKK